MQHALSEHEFKNDQIDDARTPFVVEVSHRRDKNNGVVPSARVIVSPRLRASGLLRALTPDDLKSLLFVLTYATSNGHFFASVQLLAKAMGVSESKARQRLPRLTESTFEGKPLLSEIVRESGLNTFSPLPDVVSVVSISPEPVSSQSTPAAVARADDVIAYSRQHHAHPRMDVERGIATRNGWPLPEGAEPLTTEELKPAIEERLIKIGLMPDVVRTLLRGYPLLSIQRQIEWLPYRGAKFPDRYLLAAIEGDYGMPAELGRTPDPVEMSIPIEGATNTTTP